MANALLLDIVTYFAKLNIVKGDGIDTFRDFVPAEPDSIVVLTEYQGSPIVPYELSVHRSVQVSVRDKSANAARLKALELFHALRSDSLIIKFNEDRWGQVSLRQTPIRLGTDQQNRVTYGFNIGITTTID